MLKEYYHDAPAPEALLRAMHAQVGLCTGAPEHLSVPRAFPQCQAIMCGVENDDLEGNSNRSKQGQT